MPLTQYQPHANPIEAALPVQGLDLGQLTPYPRLNKTGAAMLPATPSDLQPYQSKSKTNPELAHNVDDTRQTTQHVRMNTGCIFRSTMPGHASVIHNGGAN